MKQLTILFAILLFAMSACNDESESLLNTESGTVVDFAGSGNCGIVIELDNGKQIQPMYFPEEFTFTAGQRVLVEYLELNKVVTSCTQGIPCEISYVEELSCAGYIDLPLEDYDSLQRDPVHMHEAIMDGDCLYFKLSYAGGCQEHSIDLARILIEGAGNDEVPVFEIRHNANDDLCEAWFTREFRFDISTLREEGVGSFSIVAPLDNGEVFTRTFLLN